jgi:hypothetical protein
MHDFFPNQCIYCNLYVVNVIMYFSISRHSLRNSTGSEQHPRDCYSYFAKTLIKL